MIPKDSEFTSEREMDPSSQSQSSEQQMSRNESSSLGRQTSIYSLTLDEFQSTLCESDKNFGSMNMDEFLNSIWNAEENQAQTQTSNITTTNGNMQYPPPGQLQHSSMDHKGMGMGIARQGSLALPEPLSGKTVDEVWSDIHKNIRQNEYIQNPNTTRTQSTLGEMTLEDFLVRAGVVRQQPFAPGFAMYQNNAHPLMVPTNFVARPGIGVGVAPPNVATYQTLQSGVGEATQPRFTKRGGGYSQPPSGINYGARLGNGSGGGFGQVIGSPVSPLSDADGGNQYGGSRKRVIDGPVEKVVERRQRRMIKNRESAARSRARKQAYTVELEAELNQLKEENLQLQQTLAEIERKRQQQQCYEEEAARAAQTQSKSYKANEKLRAMRRSSSCPF